MLASFHLTGKGLHRVDLFLTIPFVRLIRLLGFQINFIRFSQWNSLFEFVELVPRFLRCRVQVRFQSSLNLLSLVKVRVIRVLFGKLKHLLIIIILVTDLTLNFGTASAFLWVPFLSLAGLWSTAAIAYIAGPTRQTGSNATKRHRKPSSRLWQLRSALATLNAKFSRTCLACTRGWCLRVKDSVLMSRLEKQSLDLHVRLAFCTEGLRSFLADLETQPMASAGFYHCSSCEGSSIGLTYHGTERHS